VRRPTSPLLALLAALLLVGAAAACSGDDGGKRSSGGTSSTASTVAGEETTTTVPAELEPYLIAASDLPAGFAPTGSVDDTITSFCANEDAAAGLQATKRGVRAFNRSPAGASVLQMAFHFREGDGARFVEQAGQVLSRCSNVPDIHGLAFTYSPVDPAVDAALEGAEDHVARFGQSAGNGQLTEEIAVFHRGDVATLVAVLAVNASRADLDALATAAFRAAAQRLAG
jgi:hypothetical protein